MTKFKKIMIYIVLAIVAVVLALWAFVAWYVHIGPSIPPARPGTIRVACVGDSITQGLPFNQENGYPWQLEQKLGEKYSVRNFGASGYTVQKEADHPYWKHRYLRLSQEFAPDIVVIMLGTNDSKTQNWSGPERVSASYLQLIQQYQSLASKPRIILMTPPSVFLVKGRTELPFGMSDANVSMIADTVKKIGAQLNLQVVDVHGITASRAEFFQRDGIHPNGGGHQLISSALALAIADPQSK